MQMLAQQCKLCFERCFAGFCVGIVCWQVLHAVPEKCWRVPTCVECLACRSPVAACTCVLRAVS
jgi:hypothetical protein